MKSNISNYDLQREDAQRLFLGYDQEQLIRKFRLTAEDGWMYLPYLGSMLRICRADGRVEEHNGALWQECRNFNTVMTVYDLLCFHQGAHMPTLSGQWCTVGNFIVTGVQNTDTFTRKYAAAFDGNVPALRQACEALGGVFLPSLAGADLSCRFPVTPFFPLLFQFWSGDEDFPAQIKLLWDRNTTQFLHFETTFYLQGDLLSRLARRIP